MLGLENPEEVLMILDRYRTLKQKNIPKELDEYLSYVAKTGDPVYNWSTIQYLFREKLTTVIREFHDTTPSLDGNILKIKLWDADMHRILGYVVCVWVLYPSVHFQSCRLVPM